MKDVGLGAARLSYGQHCFVRVGNSVLRASKRLRGNVYLRTLLIQGARSTLQAAMNREPARASRLQRWIIELYGRKGYYKTLIAIANKHARILCAMLAKGERYDASAWQRHPMHQPPLAGNA